jgi:hypothetical protein
MYDTALLFFLIVAHLTLIYIMRKRIRSEERNKISLECARIIIDLKEDVSRIVNQPTFDDIARDYCMRLIEEQEKKIAEVILSTPYNPSNNATISSVK